MIPCQQLLSVGATDAEDKADKSHTSARTRLTAANKTRLLKPPDTSKISALQSLYRSDDCATGQQSTTYCTDRWRQVRGKRRDFEQCRQELPCSNNDNEDGHGCWRPSFRRLAQTTSPSSRAVRAATRDRQSKGGPALARVSRFRQRGQRGRRCR